MKLIFESRHVSLNWITAKTYDVGADVMLAPAFVLRIGRYVYNRDKGWRNLRNDVAVLAKGANLDQSSEIENLEAMVRTRNDVILAQKETIRELVETVKRYAPNGGRCG